MTRLTTKVKVAVLALIGCAAAASYFLYIKHRHLTMNHVQKSFIIPTDRVYKEVLANGMHVIVFQNASLPKVLVQIAYDVGSYVEESGERGLAHLIEHMIFKGTDKFSETDIDTLARKYGASFNAYTSLDVTSYHFETNKNNWKPFLAILADCMQNARFDDQHLASEVKAVVQELKMNKDSFGRCILYKALEQMFPPYHPYHTPTIGFKEDLLDLNAESLKRFYKKYYRPDRATLFIVGDVDVKQALNEAREHFGGIKADGTSIKKPFPTVIPDIITTHTVQYEDVQAEKIGLFWPIPGIRSSTELVASAIELLLGAGQSGRLQHLLVDQEKVAASVSVGAYKFMEAGLFLIFIQPMPGMRDRCIQLVQQELAAVTKNGVTSQELERIAKTESKNFFHHMQDFEEFTHEWIQSYFATGDELNIFKRVNQYYVITSDDIKQYMAQYLDPFLMNSMCVVPLPEAKKSLKEHIRKLTDDLDKKILARHQRTTPIEKPKAAPSYPSPVPLSFQFPKPDKIIELPNALKVILSARHDTPLIAFNCQFKDSYCLSDTREGISLEIMMEMLMEGSKKYTKKENVDLFESNGASYAFDAQGARFSCLRQDFEVLFERFLHIITNPSFGQEALDKLKQIYVEQYTQLKDSPKDVGMRLLKNTLYHDHPFEWTFDDAIKIVKALTLADLQQLHATYVCPINMTIAVIGDFDTEYMAHYLQNHVTIWEKGTQKRFVPTPRVSQTASIDHKMLRDQVVLLFGRPSTMTIYDRDIVPLKLLNTICFRSLGSRMYQLREQTGLFYNAFGLFAANATKERGFDYCGMIVNPDNLAIAQERVMALLERVAKEGVTAQELDAARIMYLKDLIDMVTENMSIARMMCTLDALDLGFDYYDEVLERVQQIPLEQVNKVAAHYCQPTGLVRVRVGQGF